MTSTSPTLDFLLHYTRHVFYKLMSLQIGKLKFKEYATEVWL